MPPALPHGNGLVATVIGQGIPARAEDTSQDRCGTPGISGLRQFGPPVCETQTEIAGLPLDAAARLPALRAVLRLNGRMPAESCRILR